MQRWWFLDTKTKLNEPPSVTSLPTTKSVASVDLERPWTFTVHVAQQLHAFEAVAVTGECATLGNWEPQHGFLLQKQNDGEAWKGG